jgi:NAD dependent epimerase/dehydratase family enzyme
MKLLFGGELAAELLLSGQRVLPRRLEAAGFQFEHPRIEDALNAIFKRRAA